MCSCLGLTFVRGRVVGMGSPSALRVSFSSSVRLTCRLHMKCCGGKGGKKRDH